MIFVNDLLIIGAGTFSTEVEELAILLGYSNVAFVDDSVPGCIGTTDDIFKLHKEFDDAIVALGNNANRKKYTTVLEECGYNIPTLIHPTAYVSKDAEIGYGCIVRAKSVISRYAKLGKGVIVNVGGLIDHHCVVGDYSHILMGAVVRNCINLPPLTLVNSNNVAE